MKERIYDRTTSGHLVFLHQDTNLYLGFRMLVLHAHGNQLLILDVTQKALIYILFTQ